LLETAFNFGAPRLPRNLIFGPKMGLFGPRAVGFLP
jgi:hypothetical protein